LPLRAETAARGRHRCSQDAAGYVPSNLRYLRPGEFSPDADVVILPGTKSTIDDLDYLRKKSIDKELAAYVARGRGILIGICGGYQILGKKLIDPAGVESEKKETAGLGLLDVHTLFLAEKHLYQVEAVHLESGLPVRGYEIHMGETERSPIVRPAIRIARRNSSQNLQLDDGAVSADGNTWGTYLHGIFDDDTFRRRFIDSIRIRKSLPPLGTLMTRYDVDAEYDKLAALLREHLDTRRLYEILNRPYTISA